MKKNKGRKKIALIMVFLLMISLTGCASSTTGKTVKLSVSEDYYGAINYDLLQDKTIPATEGEWTYFYELDEQTSVQLQEIVSELSNSGETYPKGSSEQKISDLYACATDLDNRNAQGLTAVTPYLEQIESARNLDEYLDGLIALSGIGETSLIRYGYYQDDMNSDTMMIAFESMDDLIGKEYIENDSMQEYCDAYKVYIREMLILSGEEKGAAGANAEAVYAFASEVAAQALPPEAFYNPDSYYNAYSYDELLALYANINMPKYLEAQGLSREDHYIVMEVAAAKQINALFTEENLSVLKEYTKFVVLNDLADYAPVDYRDLKLEMAMKLDGSTEKKSDVRLAFDEVSTFLEWEFGKIYVAKYFDEKAKQDVKTMVATIIEEYKKIINAQDWMSPETKQKAILKLDTMDLKIGYPDQWSTIGDYLKVTPLAEGGNYLDNAIELQKAARQFDYDEYKKGVNREQWYMPPQTVNAYYNPANNEIVFPAAILQAPYFDADQSNGKNLGGIGAVIAHEISHAFDKNGSLYDEKGNYNIWWTDAEYQKYDALSQKIIDYYGNYTISTGDSVDGTLTLSENIADLGALTAVTAVAEKQGQSLEDVYTNWATIWAKVSTPDLEKSYLITDVHAPALVRVNAVLSSIDTFYEIYGIKAGDKMYVAPEDRVAIWQTNAAQ
ncbi:M13-type metalloendopeptidase [Acetobacterium sp.]|uniref:M13-type metalloendopeptidase n=1 Tax=Acetobacterium sp. TaxID=1872094 RepID=UPI00272587E5|nr:M13 family metallopeptidase [Acetobacterium sp.]MDO9493651.1 M13 family metallopeptidase [Acetobacterium sp.]